jgi:transcriptional regulator NrdR family protein
MLCLHCNGKSTVVTSIKLYDGVKRYRKCVDCKRQFQTMESIITNVPVLKPVVEKKELFTQKEVSAAKMKKVNARRANEDRVRVSNYYIEEDYDG